jgi:hypothetical protein
LRRAEGGAKIVGVFRVKNHDFTPKYHIFSNFRGGGRAPGAPPPGSAPEVCNSSHWRVLFHTSQVLLTFWYINHKKIKGKEFIHVTSIYTVL